MGESWGDRRELAEGSSGIFGVGGTEVQIPALPLISHVSMGGLPDLWPSWTSIALSVKWAHQLSYVAPVRLDELGKLLGTC